MTKRNILFNYRGIFGGGNGVNSYIIGSPILALASHSDVTSNNTTSMSTTSTSTITGTSMTSIIENKYQ